jgi:hypothetical protein
MLPSKNKGDELEKLALGPWSADPSGELKAKASSRSLAQDEAVRTLHRPEWLRIVLLALSYVKGFMGVTSSCLCKYREGASFPPPAPSAAY